MNEVVPIFMIDTERVADQNRYTIWDVANEHAYPGFYLTKTDAVEAIKALSASRSVNPPDGWRDISTAPKGEKVLLWSPKSRWSIADWADYCVHNQPKFTHWKPLDEPPASNTDGEGTR